MAAGGVVLPPREGPDPHHTIRNFARHFVHLQYQVRAPQKPCEVQRSGISGIVIEVGGEWILLTTGHCLQRVESAVEQGYTFDQWRLDDASRRLGAVGASK